MKTTPTREISCPKCGALPGQHCKGSRIPSSNTLGGGWGGPPTLSRSHPERVQARRDLDQKRLELRAEKLAAKADEVATELIELSEQLAEVNRAQRGPEAPDPRQVIMWIEDLAALADRGTLGQVIDYLKQWRDLQGGYTD